MKLHELFALIFMNQSEELVRGSNTLNKPAKLRRFCLEIIGRAGTKEHTLGG